MNKNLMRVGAAVVVALALVGCSSIQAGFITDKKYYAAWVEQKPVCWYGVDYPGIMNYPSKGSPYPCLISSYRSINHPPTYRFDIKKQDKTGWVFVTHPEFDRLSVGDWYENG